MMDSEKESELFQLMDQYMVSLDSGTPLDLEDLQRLHPDLAQEIAQCAESLKMLCKDTQPLKRGDYPYSTDPLDGTDFTACKESESTSGLSDTPWKESSFKEDPKPVFPNSQRELLGDFQLIREIGRGGMGVVYEARQCSLGRTVALKMLPFASTMDSRQLQRFHNEAAAAAHLEHPGIVPIYAVGCERGIHFYAMRYINGQHLGAMISQLRAMRNKPELEVSSEDTQQSTQVYTSSNSMQKTQVSDSMKNHAGQDMRDAEKSAFPQRKKEEISPTLAPYELVTREMFGYSRNRNVFYREAAELMRQAASALDYAHQCGVIHRDIKPANLMVDTSGNLWITDFGLAHIQSNIQLTMTGEVFGTPRYMSPEQAGGQMHLADHRTDIYSLGATFYELLTLKPIFSERNQGKLLQKIEHEDPVMPHEYDSHIPHDLETIILKCISKQADDRYRTAGELGADLQRFLEDRPVTARRPSLFQRGMKWGKRHPGYMVSILFLLLVAVVVQGLFHHMIYRERQNTLLALKEAQKRTQEAELRFAQARNLADKLINIVEEDMNGVVSPEMRLTRQKLLDTALVLYQDFLNSDELDAETQHQLTAMRDYVQRFMRNIADLEGRHALFLLKRPDVQADLKLTELQKKQLFEFEHNMERHGEELFRHSRNMTAEQRLEKMLEGVKNAEVQAAKILTTQQSVRLEQIAYQLCPDSFLKKEVMEKLALTQQQQSEIQKVIIQHEGFRFLERPRGDAPIPGMNRERQPWRLENSAIAEDVIGKKNAPPFLGGFPLPNPDFLNMSGPPPEKENPPFPKKDDARLLKALEGILTQQQSKIWEQMKGTPFSPQFRKPQPEKMNRRNDLRP